MHERVQKLNHLSVETGELAVQFSAIFLVSFVVGCQTLKPLGVVNVLGDYIEDFDLVVSCYLVAGSTLLNLKRYV